MSAVAQRQLRAVARCGAGRCGAGRDGGAGNDVYLFGRGAGQDTVAEQDATIGNVNTIKLAADVLPGDVTLRGKSLR